MKRGTLILITVAVTLVALFGALWLVGYDRLGEGWITGLFLEGITLSEQDKAQVSIGLPGENALPVEDAALKTGLCDLAEQAKAHTGAQSGDEVLILRFGMRAFSVLDTGDGMVLAADGKRYAISQEALRALLESDAAQPLFGAVVPPNVTVMGEALSPTYYEWTVKRIFDEVATDGERPPVSLLIDDIGMAGELGVSVPALAEHVAVEVLRDGEVVWAGDDPGELAGYLPEENGVHTLRITCGFGDRGKSVTDVELTYSLPGMVELEEMTPAMMGGVLKLTARYINPETLSVSSNLRYVPRFQGEGETSTALAPISYFTTPGSFYITVSWDGGSERFDFVVTDREFEVQRLTVDESVTSETVDNSAATAEFNRVIDSLMPIFDAEQHWSEPFELPLEVEGNLWITTEFGMIRYVNGAMSGRHDGVDLAVKSGTPVLAANRGRVIYADFLQMTGNTVLIEHGNGLKSWYYHMESLMVTEGEMVERGQQIGAVGTTGFSTGPHLHFAMSVRMTYLDPFLLIERPEESE